MAATVSPLRCHARPCRCVKTMSNGAPLAPEDLGALDTVQTVEPRRQGEVAVHGRPPRRWRTRFERATSHVLEVGPPTSGIEVPRFDLPSYTQLPLYTDLFPPHSPPRFPVPSAIPSTPPPPYSPPRSPVPSSVPSTPPPPYSPVPSCSFAAPHSPPRSPFPSSVPSTPPPPYSPVPSCSFAAPHSPPRSPVRPSSVPSTPPPPYSPVPSCSTAPPLSPPCSFAPSSSIPPSPPAPSPLVPLIVAPSELPCVPDAGLSLSPVIQDSGSTVEGTSEDLAVGETNEAPSSSSSSSSSSSTPGRGREDSDEEGAAPKRPCFTVRHCVTQ
ncbi:uncharacterized protein LOC121201827 isoform X1 [Betta splendens]|uniref:Uncharacterized protein LOC121201827 isoform X1 n=1 Tax=Betta splendens TaxID=158456 RepID=A0A9W2XF45_BETSP|nr:uncharacterized protein LOC121201827 isoform X1 [Betta splendens]XP_055360293.1 uncharacterized protein LOC121201827 isoform X1 [Betta splendens]